MVRRQFGLSLIELMITVVILTLLALLGASLSSEWINRAKVHEAKSKLNQVYGMALSLAQRNAKGVTEKTVSAGFKLKEQILFVCAGNPVDDSCKVNGAPWKTHLPSGIAVKINGSAEAIQTLAFDNTGAPRKSDGTMSETKFEITCGNESETGYLR